MFHSLRFMERQKNKESGGGSGSVIHRILCAATALVVAVATLLTGSVTASALNTNGLPGYWFNPTSAGSWWVGYHGSHLGPQQYDNGNPVYCIEAGVNITNTGNWEAATDRDSKIAAYMVNQHQSDQSDMTQAAVAYAIHAHLDRGESHFQQLIAVGLEGADINAVRTLADQFWNDAAANMPADIQANYQYTESKRKGTVNPGIKNGNGEYVAGVSYTLTINGPAVFDNTGTNTYSGVTSGQEEHIAWTATGNGNATLSVQYQDLNGVKLNSPGQDLFKKADPSTVTGSIQFEVVNNFQPTVTTEVSSKMLSAGETIKDNVTSGTANGDTWIDGVTVKAKGYYFTGDKQTILQTIKQTGTVDDPEAPADYLQRVEDTLGQPVATAETTFTGSGQTNEVTAKASNGTDYVNPEDGLFGGWLWVIVLDEQEQDQKVYIKHSYIDEFGQVPETDVHCADLYEWSEVAEPHANLDADVRDVIHLRNIPLDFGEFDGSDEYGFGADNTRFSVEVWWAGSGTGVTEEDEQYIPASEDTPEEDEHHKLLGTYEYDLKALIDELGNSFDGSLDVRVGGGDAGSPLADGSNFSITADQTGYYTFVFRYEGCDRMSGFTSAYNDKFETTFVTKTQPTLSLTSSTNPASVKVGEEFWDTATIVGTGNADGGISDGAYVLFDAYNPVSGAADPSVGKLLDSDRVTLTEQQVDDLNSGRQITVSSSRITAQQSGNVYWQAAIYAANGTLLATHELGIEDETTVIVGGGDISSVSQKQGAVGGQMWDIITVSDDTDGDDAGNIPDGSTVEVSVYKHEGQNAETEGQLVETKVFDVDTSRLGERPGSYSFQAVMNGTYPAAGTYYWVERLIGPDGGVIAEGEYGSDTERTYVQEYDTDASKAWLSANDAEYAESTIETFDVLTQSYYEQWGTDDQTGSSTSVYFGATATGTQAQFSIWREGDGGADTDVKVLDGSTIDLPKVLDRNEPYSQKVKSETFTLPENTATGTHYYMLRVTNSQDAANLAAIGIQSDGLVWESPKRVESESFEVTRVTSTAAEPIVTTDMEHVQEVLHVDGTLEAGSSYQVETWTTDADGNTVEKVGETDRITLESDVTDSDITVTVDNPSEVGSYQFRFKVWSPDNLGGSPDVDTASVDMPDDWKQGDDYAEQALLYEGTNVQSEQFNVIRISTDVTGTANMHTAKGEHYVDVTGGAQVGDYATIEGNLDREGYQLGFELYRNNGGDDTSKDTYVLSIEPTSLAAAQTELESALATLSEPGDYYWVTVFSKTSGEAFQPDGQTEVRSDRRIESESFHAVRINTTTYKWSSAGGTIRDVAHIEGTLPGDTIIGFELHDYETGDKVMDAEDSTLSDMDGYTEGAADMTVTSPEVTVPDAGDHYFVEWVLIPGDDQGEDKEFHRGNDRVDTESTRTISVNTSTFTEVHLGDTISDQTFLDNISYETDIRDDYVDQELSASWEVWKQGSGDVDTDTQLATLDKDGVKLEDGQSEAESSKWTPSQTGTYYFRVRVTADDGTLVAYGEAREPSETVVVIDSYSRTTHVVEEGQPISDKVTIEGPVLEGTMVSWRVFKQSGTTDDDEMVADWTTPTTGAYVLTAEDAQTSLDEGHVTVESPLTFDETQVGVYYFQYSLTAPARGADGEPMTPAKDESGNWTVDHLTTVGILPIADDPAYSSDFPVDGDDADTQNMPQAFYTDLARVEDETAYIVSVTTTTAGEATVGDQIHDTAHIEGTIPNGNDYCVEFEYWEQADSDNADDDRLVTTTECVAVPAGTDVDVDSPEITADDAGTHYWRERLVYHDTGDDEREVSYGDARVEGETVVVKAKPLAQTGIAIGGIAGISALLAMGGGALALSKRRRPRGQHAA